MNSLEDCVAAALAGVSPEPLARFSADPLGAMRSDFGLKVEEAPHLIDRRADGGACDGLSFLKDGVVLYAPTSQSKRQNFTLAHELGHWLVDQVPEIFDWLWDQPQPKRALETLCDRIAQQLLLDRLSVAAIIGPGPVQAQHVVDLFGASHASMPACAIALATHLPGLGAIVLVDLDPVGGEPVVRYASVRPDNDRGWPRVYPWPGQAVPPAHPLKLVSTTKPIRQRTFWAMPWGDSADFYIDAIAVSDRRVIGVLADSDLWGAERFHPQTRRDFDERPEREVVCCGQSRTVRGYPCSTCNGGHCPNCGKCRCDRQNDELVRCGGRCFLSFKPNLLVNGLCETCR